MASENGATQNTKDLFLKAVDITWTPDLESPNEVRLESLRHRGVDHIVLRLEPEEKNKSVYSKFFGFGNSNPETASLTSITIADGALCLEQIGRKTTIALLDIRAIEISGATKKQNASLLIETCRTTLRFKNNLQESSLQWLRDRLLLETAGLIWKPIFNVGKRSTAKTVSQDLDTFTLWPTGRNTLLDFFFSQAPKKASELIAAVKSKDADVVRSRAEWLKSSCAVVGAGYLSGLCQRLEVQVANQEYERILVLVQSFEAEFNSVLKHLCKISDRTADEVGLLEETVSNIESPPVPISAKILLVEDSLVNQELATSLLSDAGHQTTIASHGGEALNVLEKESFDLILMDCQMPGFDGIETTKKIRANEHHQGRARTPIVALTANALKDDRKRCIDASMDDYLSKPYSPHELISIVNLWIARSDQVESAPDRDAVYSRAGR